MAPVAATDSAAAARVANARDGYERGWSFTPLNGKIPRRHGWTTAARESLEEALEWAAAGNVGLRTGAASGVCVIDADVGADLAPLDLPPTVTVMTGRGGTHFYFVHPGTLGNSAGKLGPHIDTRGDGGQVVFPGATHPTTGAAYEWVSGSEPWSVPLADLPAHILERLRAAGAAAAAPVADRISEGARNAALASLAGSMRRRGMTQGAIRAALAAENVERCIPPLPDAEVAQIATSIGRYPPATGGSNRETESDPAPVLCCMADIAPEPLRWLWPGRLPLGKAALVFGDPGFGKTLVTQDMAARVSRGIPWPDLPGERTAPGGVVILSAEDDAADTIRPRLDAAGADPRRIFLLRGVKTGDGANAAHFNLACDLPALEAAIRQTPDARLVIIDPISAYLGGTDSHRNSEVRGLLAPLADLAARYDVALVAVSHLNKGAGGRALYRATGSLAFVAAARAAWLVIADPEDANRRLFLPAKMNLAEEPSGLAYRIVPVTLDGIGPVARVEWERDAVNIRADEALAAAASGENRTAQDAAGAWLRDALAGGAVPQKDLVERAERDGIKAHTLYRAKTALGVIAGKQGLSGGWTWRLP